MSFIIILLSLILEHYLKSSEDLKRFDWFYQFADWVHKKRNTQHYVNAPLDVILTIAPVVFIVWLCAYGLGDISILLGMLFSIGVLFFCLGPKDIAHEVKRYIEAMEKGDSEDALLHASEFIGSQSPHSPVELAQMMKETLFIKINDRILGVLLWFVLLGPLGAILFRLACIEHERVTEETNDYANSVRRLYNILIWPSARLCIFAFTIVGSFVGVVSNWKGISDLWEQDSQTLLIRSGLGALQGNAAKTQITDEPDLPGVNEALALVKRAVIVWIAVFAALTISGWLI